MNIEINKNLRITSELNGLMNHLLRQSTAETLQELAGDVKTIKGIIDRVCAENASTGLTRSEAQNG